MTNIPIKAAGFGELQKPARYNESDVSSLGFEEPGFRVVVKYWNNSVRRKDALLEWKRDDIRQQQKSVEVRFHGFTRHRVLEEIDLQSYWRSNEFKSGHLVFEILSGGWLAYDAAGEQLIDVGFTPGLREWFICTSNLSVFVLSQKEPSIRVIHEG